MDTSVLFLYFFEHTVPVLYTIPMVAGAWGFSLKICDKVLWHTWKRGESVYRKAVKVDDEIECIYGCWVLGCLCIFELIVQYMTCVCLCLSERQEGRNAHWLSLLICYAMSSGSRVATGVHFFLSLARWYVEDWYRWTVWEKCSVDVTTFYAWACVQSILDIFAAKIVSFNFFFKQVRKLK